MSLSSRQKGGNRKSGQGFPLMHADASSEFKRLVTWNMRTHGPVMTRQPRECDPVGTPPREHTKTGGIVEETVCTSAIKSIKYLIQNFRRTKQSLCGEILEHPERYKSRTKKKKGKYCATGGNNCRLCSHESPGTAWIHSSPWARGWLQGSPQEWNVVAVTS